MKFSMVVPCFNEAPNIPLLLERFASVVDFKEMEVLFVNNGSTDDSEKVFEEWIPKYPFARNIRLKKNQGYGFGVFSGLKEAKGTFLGYTHADLQTNPADLLIALKMIECQNNPETSFVKGNRKGRELQDQIFTWGMSFFESIYLQTQLWDINAQPNVFHRSFFDKIQENCPKDFSLDLYLLYKAHQLAMNVVRFDVSFTNRIHGKSSWNTGLASKWKFIKRTLEFSRKLKRTL